MLDKTTFFPKSTNTPHLPIWSLSIANEAYLKIEAKSITLSYPNLVPQTPPCCCALKCSGSTNFLKQDYGTEKWGHLRNIILNLWGICLYLLRIFSVLIFINVHPNQTLPPQRFFMYASLALWLALPRAVQLSSYTPAASDDTLSSFWSMCSDKSQKDNG